MELPGGRCNSLPWQLAENWETGVQSLVWAKSLTPGLAFINPFYEMIISVRIDSCVDYLIWIICYTLFLIF